MADGAHAQRRAIWVINAACPSRCVYCGIGSQRARAELDEPTAVRVANQLVDAGFGEVTFVGGEPLLYQHLPAVLAALRGRCTTAVFTGGLPGAPERWVDVLRAGASRLVLSIDAGDETLNDQIRGRLGVTRELLGIAAAVRRELPSLELSVSTVVTRHNVAALDPLWGRIRPLAPTAWVAVLAGDNFLETPERHFVDRAALETLYLESAPALARRVALEAPDTDFLLFPVPLPFLESEVPIADWGAHASGHGPELAGELERYAAGNHNASFVARFGCPLVGSDVTIGVEGEVYPCSQAPILKPEYALGSLREHALSTLLDGETLRGFSRGLPHPPCRRCWAPSNVAPSTLRALFARGP